MNSITPPELMELTGRARIRAMFHPKQRIGLIAAGTAIGVSYSRLFRRLQEGKLDLKVRKDEYGQMYVTVEDLAVYLYPDETGTTTQAPPKDKRKVGRPRKGTEGGVR